MPPSPSAPRPPSRLAVVLAVGLTAIALGTCISTPLLRGRGDAQRVDQVFGECREAGVDSAACTELFGGGARLRAWQETVVDADGLPCGDLISLETNGVGTEGAVYSTDRGWFAGTTRFRGVFETASCSGTFALAFTTQHGTTEITELSIDDGRPGRGRITADNRPRAQSH